MILRQRLGLVFFILGICGFFDAKYSGHFDYWVFVFCFMQALGISMFLLGERKK